MGPFNIYLLIRLPLRHYEVTSKYVPDAGNTNVGKMRPLKEGHGDRSSPLNCSLKDYVSGAMTEVGMGCSERCSESPSRAQTWPDPE